MSITTEKNKEIVLRFNRDVLEQGKIESFHELVASNVINHAAPEGAPNGPESMTHFLFGILRTGFPDITVEILDQIAEGDKVTTRKILRGTHTGDFMGISPSHKKVAIKVIDIIRLHGGQYAEHWGMSNLSDVTRELSR
jgi:predicted ester cyclase